MNHSQPPSVGTPVFDTVLALLRSAIWGESLFPFQPSAETDWEAVYNELCQQTVQHLPAEILVREDLRRKAMYTNHAARNVLCWLKIMQLQHSLCAQLHAAGIPCAVLKGSSAARYYPQPSYRVMGDIDLLVMPSQFDGACQLLLTQGEYLGESWRHQEYRINGIIVELHRTAGPLRNAEKIALLGNRLFSAIPSAETIAIEGYSFYSLPPVENGLSLLSHIDQHLEIGLGLRQIIDWMLFVDRELDDALWYGEFQPFLNRLGRTKLAVTVTRMCQIYLGLRKDITWCSDADDRLCTKLMAHIFHQGNFGRKNQAGLNRAVGVVRASKNKGAFLKIMQQHGCQNWKAVKRYPFLKPFAWLYQIVWYISRGLRADKPLQLLRNAVRKANTQTNLMEELEAYRMDDES